MGSASLVPACEETLGRISLEIPLFVEGKDSLKNELSRVTLGSKSLIRDFHQKQKSSS